MKNPGKYLRDYLWTLIVHYAYYINGLRKQRNLIHEWNRREGPDAINISAYFFKLVDGCFSRTILLELWKLVDKKEKRSLWDWLQKAKVHAASIGPTRYKPNDISGTREAISPDEYRGIIDGHLALLDSKADLIGRLTMLRHKILAHTDAKYFQDIQGAYKDYPAQWTEIDTLMRVVEKIMGDHHVHLLESAISMEVGGRDVNQILAYASAFYKLRKDKDLIHTGFRPAKYLPSAETSILADRETE